MVNATPRSLYPGKKTKYPLYRSLGGSQGRSGWEPTPGFDCRMLEPVRASHTVCIIPTHDVGQRRRRARTSVGTDHEAYLHKKHRNADTRALCDRKCVPSVGQAAVMPEPSTADIRLTYHLTNTVCFWPLLLLSACGWASE
jgi:hypothetical protein